EASVDDLFAVVFGDRCQPLPPQLQIRRAQSLPVADLADHAQRLGAALRTGRVAWELLVGDIRVVLELGGGLDLVDMQLPAETVGLGPQCGHLGGQARTVRQRREVDVIHRHLGAVVRGVPGGEQITGLQGGSRPVEERALIKRLRHDSNIAVQSAHDGDRKSTRLNSSHVSISYAVFCLKKKIKSSGIHSNGYSIVRPVITDLDLYKY